MTMKTFRLDSVFGETSRAEVKYTSKKSCRIMTGMNGYYAQVPASPQGNTGIYEGLRG